jgi:DNA-binding SARP family transcriptional activator
MGDRKSAISQYERYYKTLNEELNITPKKEIQDLYFRLIKNQN